ncbi:MAG: PAS domain-containing sensor histidine kinase [Deltaproteobacteria bacterium HGW-Deltaproteobacteria-4]|nr:MAG: PAS domain-containing sensor histidine kinase [Deltaproteobacteria bacterium HGW-Deltaproteobacteria-4]
MRFSIRWKLLATYLLVLLVMGGTLFVYLDRTLEQQLTENLRNSLYQEAELTVLFSDPASLSPALVREIAARTASRLSIIAADGTVLADSQVADVDLAAVENHLSRPEIAAALQNGRGSTVRHSATIGIDMLYAAVRLDPKTAKKGVLRLALPLQAVKEAQTSLRQSLILAFLLSGLLAGGLSLLLIQLFSNTLHNLSEGAKRFGSGDFRRKLSITGNDEISDLARVMNTMAESLNLQMANLEAQRNRLDTILRGMGEGLLVADRSGIVLLINPAFCSLFRVTADAVGQPLINLSRHPTLHETFRRVLTGRSEESGEFVLDGNTTLLTHWVPLLDNNELIGVVAVFHDISELKRLETIRRDFVANVSHELRTPVTVIRGYAETLGSGLISKDPATAERFANVIKNHAERLTSLISDLLTLSQLEVQGFTLTLAPCDLNERLQHCCELVKPKAEEKEISITISPLPPGKILADAQRLEQILFNLLDNAVKYTPNGGAVTINVSNEGELMRIAIDDTGPGVPEAAQQRIFERFYRADAGRSREEGGTGLGLAIAKHLVGLHGGSIGVTNRRKGGSSFFFTLHRAPSGS